MGSNSRVGEIVLLDLPNINACGSKVRPGMILHDHAEHGRKSGVTLAYMTTEVDRYAHSPHAVVVEQQDLAFGTLKMTSVVRTDKVITIDPSICRRIRVAKLNPAKLRLLLRTAGYALARSSFQAVHEPVAQADFVPGTSRINYAGRVFDEQEMYNLVDSALDFWLTSGRYALQFEQNLAAFLGVKHCSLVNSGSSANLLALMALTSPKLGNDRIRPGDEVITVAAAFPTTVAPILQAGAVPVFVDVRLPDANVDPDKLEQAITPRTKAVVLAHALGFPFDLDRVFALCQRYGLWLIEDNCDALGASYQFQGNWRNTGTVGHIGTSSFYPPHHITMGEGGAVYTDDITLKRIVESLRDWGRDCWCAPGTDNSCKKRFSQQFSGLPLGYDHKYVYSHLGYNLKATDMQAAVGCAQLQKLKEFIALRLKNFSRMLNGLKSLHHFFYLPEVTSRTRPSPFGFMLHVRDDAGFTRNDLTSYLEKHNIQTRNLFAGNLLRHPCFDTLQEGVDYRISGKLETTDRIMNNTFWLGVYPGITAEMTDYIVGRIEAFVKNT